MINATSLQDFVSLVYEVCDTMKAFYILPGFSLWQFFQIMMWLSAFVSIYWAIMNIFGFKAGGEDD